MSCASCSTAISDGEVAGCQSNGNCKTGGCNKMNTFDWLAGMDMPPTEKFEFVEVRFKNGRKDFFKNKSDLELNTGDAVVVDVPNGHHIGYVSLQGELVRLQMRKKGVKTDGDIRSIYRIASERDMEKFADVRKREMGTLYRTREIIIETGLKMKLTDVEFQADGTKATFYYSADERVDFRELIKQLAGEFRIRVDMRQISLRQEAGRIGGIGSCGRELCCSTWMSSFATVSTQAARYQNLSLNPGKLSGQCGRLKCCLNYELDTYMDALKGIPEVKRPLLTDIGEARLEKTDIFKLTMWFSYADENTWHPVDVERVKEIIAMNKAGEKPATLQDDELMVDDSTASLNDDLIAMDKKFNKKRKKKRRNKPRNQGGKPQNKHRNKGGIPKSK